ncbi:hypothetical protein, partial [Pseudomonas aeruginosa]
MGRSVRRAERGPSCAATSIVLPAGAR